ncbi:glycosyltransferase [Microbacterium sp. Marseille-Q6648]|uniref:glycosyltransferase n=1 Tax=Microbacterium sp. Marseille-Q6648 TaxID=2937991 RepID=UPI00203EFC81|nr:glycosyltransferase [Microbacterium sp. Marseille-Q6648]
MDLVVISLEQWDAVWRRNQHLVWRLLERDAELRVLFVEPPADPTHDLRSRRRPQLGHRPDDTILPGRLWRMRPLKPLPRRIDLRADERLASQIERAARDIGMTAPVLWVNDPGGAVVARRTGWPTLYDMTDDWLAADRAPGELARVAEQERWLLARAAQVVACSPELLRRKQPRRGPEHDPVALVRNAVDTAAYREPHERPADLPPGAVALYVGTLHADRLDVGLTVRLAGALTGRATVVLVGPDVLSSSARERLRGAGVVLLGPKPSAAVVGYLQHADVLIVPHVVTAFTDSLDPIKLYEYQAADRPVVSTPVAGFKDSDDSRIRVAEPDEFTKAVHLSLAAPVALNPIRGSLADWDDRATQMAAVLNALGNG